MRHSPQWRLTSRLRQHTHDDSEGARRRRRGAAGEFMQPVAYAADIQQPEQRIGQLGFRFSF
jgi:hypothetical protein